MPLRPGTLLVAACVSWAGCGHGGLGAASSAAADPAWMFVRQVPFVQQKGELDCGAAALAMALGHGGRPTRVEDITSVVAPEGDKGIYATELRDFARRLRFEAYLISGTPEDLQTEIGRGHPIVVGLVKTKGRRTFSHYELVVGMRRDRTRIITLDPASGPREQSTAKFMAEWAGSSQAALVIWRAMSSSTTMTTGRSSVDDVAGPRTLGAESPRP